MAETIEYCLRNVDGETRERLRADACAPTGADATGPGAGDIDASDTDVDDTEVVERRCLQRCGDCHRGDFLVVDGALATGGSHTALLDQHLPEGDR